MTGAGSVILNDEKAMIVVVETRKLRKRNGQKSMRGKNTLPRMAGQ